MSHSTEVIPTWSWLRAVSRELFELDSRLPQAHVAFPWKKLETALEKALNLASLKIEQGEIRWREENELSQGIAAPFKRIVVQASGVDGTVSLLLPETLIETLLGALLQLDASVVRALPSDFHESFFHFIVAEALFQMNTLSFEKLSFSLYEKNEPILEHSMGQDFFIELDQKRYAARALISQNFQIVLYGRAPPQPSQARLQSLNLPMHVIAGTTTLSTKELLATRPGDFLSIERAYFDPDSEAKNCYLMVAGHPIFRAALQNHQLIIQEIPSHEEVSNMVNNIMPDKLEKESDPAAGHHELHSSEADASENKSAEEIEDEDAGADLFGQEESAEEDDDDEYMIEETLPSSEEKEEHKEAHEHAQEVSHAEKEVHATHVVVEHPAIKVGSTELTLNDIPVTLNIELAELEISAQKLLELQPGSMLDLAHDGSSVLLVVRGKVIGKGEIMKIGTTLGVRVLEIGA